MKILHVIRHNKYKKKNDALKNNVLDRSAYSPDLNPIENLWSHMMRNIYANGRKFDDVDKL